MSDARFEDGSEAPLILNAADTDDLQVMSALVQDAVLPVTEIRWDRDRRQLALLINRFRHERPATATPERVRSLLVIEDVLAVASQGVRRDDRDLVLSILALGWTPEADGAGRIELVLAGDGMLAADVECINLQLRDVSRPYVAPSGHAPDHDL